MMRTLKFRIWDKKEKQFQGFPPTIVCDFEKKIFEFSGSSHQRENWIFQQWTGEFDKNKKEIYEGDIVRVTSDEWGNENFIAEVIFSDASFLSKIDDNDIRGLWGGDDIEVIGSIFQLPCNPDHNGECLVCDSWLSDCPFLNKENKL